MRGQPRGGGRPRIPVDQGEIRRLRASGLSWRKIGHRIGIGASTALYLARDGTTPRPPRRPVQKPLGDVQAWVEGQRDGSGVPAGMATIKNGENGRSDRLPDLAVRLKALGVVLRFRGGRLDPEGGAVLERLPAGVHEAWLWVGLEARKR